MRDFETIDYKLKTLKTSMFAISSVVLVEAFLGLAVGSLAILSDGLHALLDALTAFALFITTRASIKPPDEEHMYGHEKFESIGGLIGGMGLIGVALLVLIESILKLIENKPYINLELQFAGFIAIGYTFFVDFFRVALLRKAGRSESPTLKTGLYHAIADLGSTVIAVFGFGLATVGLYYGDSLSSVILSVLLTLLSLRLVWSSGMELTDAISKDVVTRVKTEISSVKGAYKCERLRVRKSGERIFIKATLKVPDYVSLEEAHEMSAKMELNIKNAIGNADITFHIEPMGTREMPTEKLVEKLAAEVKGVEEAHDVSIAYTRGKPYVTLHAQVNPGMSIKEAHEIAEEIESKIARNMENLGNVTVHIEPFSAGLMRGYGIDESDIRRIVEKAAENYKHNLQIKRIVTYVSGEKRYINIDCVFSGKVSIEEAHKIASQTEEQVKERFAETSVTVHIEPSHDENKH